MVDPKDVGEVAWKPASNSSGEMEIWSSPVLGERGGSDVAQIVWLEGSPALGTGSPAPVVGRNSASLVVDSGSSIPIT